MIYEALFLPVTEEKEGKEGTKRERKRVKNRAGVGCEEQAQGEGGQESVEETSITLRPLD